MRVDAADPVDKILSHHGICGPWAPLHATGLANRIYATADVVLRVATDHPEAIEDARTESIAAPVARAAGILVPRLIAFDDSRSLLDRPYSLWERIHGETVGMVSSDVPVRGGTWHQVGRQLAQLHDRVRECHDPNGWLDRPGRAVDLSDRVDNLLDGGHLKPAVAAEIRRWIDVLEPQISASTPTRFLHHDLHAMNLMCSGDGTLLAIIDWGDAGWGDPALDFSFMPLAALPVALAAYESEAPDYLGPSPEPRILWSRLEYALEELPRGARPLDDLREFLLTTPPRWRRGLGGATL